jgi:hypothetical protein
MKRSLLKVIWSKSGRRLMVVATIAGFKFVLAEIGRRARESHAKKRGFKHRLLPGRS